MYHRLQALVLRTTVSSEADKTVMLYTREWGKIAAVVPGAKKIRAKHSAAAEPVMECDFSVYLNSPNARPKVTGVKILNSFTALRCDWRRFCLAQYCSEISEALTPYHSENVLKYELLSRTWGLLETAKNPKRILSAFTLRFLKLSGYSFLDYIKRGNLKTTAKMQDAICKISTLSGEDVDLMLDLDEATERGMESHLDSYLGLYLTRPLSVKKFLRKIDVMENHLISVVNG